MVVEPQGFQPMRFCLQRMVFGATENTKIHSGLTCFFLVN